MSLHAAAKHLSDQGRGPDNTLVHMSRDEVKSLNDLAMAHGGHLTINPETGLPEAGFLSSILPMVAGAALNAYAPGLGAMGSALITGAATGALTGNLNKGLMAGLGAYGGAGLMGGFMGAGADAAAGALSAENAATAANMGEYANARDLLMARNSAPAMEMASLSPGDSALAGLKGLGTAEGREAFMGNIGGGKGLFKYGAAALAPSVLEAIKGEAPKTTSVDKDPGQKYVYSPGMVNPSPTPDPYGREQRYFNSTYTPIYAGGGAVEQMSNDNAIGANTGYPMADISKGAYATPYQTPISRNVVGGTSDTGVNPMTGEMNFADGGEIPNPGATTQYSYDPFSQSYSKIESPSEKTSQAAEMNARQSGNSAAPMSDAAFAAQQAQGEANAQALGTSVSDGAKGLLGLLNQPPIAVQIAQAVLGTLGLTGNASGFGAPGATSGNAGAMGFGPSGMAAGATSGGGSSSGASGLSGVGTSSGVGFGAPGAASGNAGAMGFGASGMAAGVGAANGGLMAAFANGGSNLGDYSDGGRLLRGPGDGVSDSIPAQIGEKQPARLADGEFVVPARIVSELGNGSTEAGARKLYAMMDRVQKARGSTTGKGNVAKNSRADKYLPA